MITLLLMVALVTFATVEPLPIGLMLIAVPFDAVAPEVPVAEVALVKVLFEMFSEVIVPSYWVMFTPWCSAFVNVLPVIVTVPVTFFSVPEPEFW